MDIAHHFGGKCYAKAAHFDCGDILVQHKHSHDHLSILAEGDRGTDLDGVRSIVSAPACLTIAAGKHHGVKALTDGVWYCIHATDSTDPDHIDHEVIAPDSTSEGCKACWRRCVEPDPLLWQGVDVRPMQQALAAHAQLWDQQQGAHVSRRLAPSRPVGHLGAVCRPGNDA
jgi:hypothetical protein